MRRSIFALLVALAVGAGSLTGIVFATSGVPYLGSGKFPTGALNWQFLTTGIGYSIPADDATTNWDDDTDLALTEVTDGTWDVLISALLYSEPWTGMALICMTNDECVGDEPDDPAPNTTYDYCVARIDRVDMDSKGTTARTSLTGHELGHCWSLAHQTRTASLMKSGQFDNVRPDADDVDHVNDRY